MFGYHQQHNGHEFEQTLQESEGQKSPACQFMGSQTVEQDLMTKQKCLFGSSQCTCKS